MSTEKQILINRVRQLEELVGILDLRVSVMATVLERLSPNYRHLQAQVLAEMGITAKDGEAEAK